MFYKESRIVIADKHRQFDIVHDIHKGSGDNGRSKVMSAHLERTPKYEKEGIYNDLADYTQNFDRCQRSQKIRY